MQLYKVLLVDDHPIMCHGLTGIINGFMNYTVIGQASNNNEGKTLFLQWKPEIVLLDLALGKGENGLELAKYIFSFNPETHVVLFTSQLSKHDRAQLKLMNIKGVLLKSGIVNELHHCLNSVVNGGSYYSSELYLDLEQRDTAGSSDNWKTLVTPTELDILRYIAQGCTSKQVAEKLNRSVATVQKHRANICTKLNISGTNGLLHFLMAQADELGV
ncbi:MAG: response regulator transcription factor [Flammeovirgaceae bacterium]